MKFVQGALVASLSAASFSTALDANQRLRGSAKSRPKVEDLIGLDDVAGYTEVAKKFVGLNPKNGPGGGFIIDTPIDAPYITSSEFRVDQPGICTCDCKPSPEGVGCVGWAGVPYLYSNMLWKDPVTGAWDGMMQANQFGSNELNFIGSDRRIYPGGPVIYSLSATERVEWTYKTFLGNFRQSTGPVSCKAGLEDKDKVLDYFTCAYRCRNSETYADWLDYCEAGHEDKSLGFSGYGM